MFSLFKDFSAEEEADFVDVGMRMTWPSLEMIKNTTAVSRTFRSCLDRLRGAARKAPAGRRGARR
jgi:hypothetical protein